MFIRLLGSWYGVSGPRVYQPMVLVLVQELLADSVISFSEVVVQLFGCSLILQELSAFFDVFEG